MSHNFCIFDAEVRIRRIVAKTILTRPKLDFGDALAAEPLTFKLAAKQ